MISATQQTKNWLENVIIKFNFCPFAKKEFVNNTILYQEIDVTNIEDAVVATIDGCAFLNENPDIETSLLIFTEGFQKFEEFLDLVELSNALLSASGYEGTFQIANFHPDYIFADSDENDAANYTNRAPFPTLHLIREASMEKAVALHPNTEAIPDTNIDLARQKGLLFWRQLLTKCQQ